MSKLPIVGPRPAPGDRRRRERLDALYTELPKLECAGRCSRSCGPIGMSRVEWQRMCKTAGEERKATTLTCPLLEDDRCSVYAVRPMICRLWGLVITMPCPWGCIPDRYLSEVEGFEFMARSREAGA